MKVKIGKYKNYFGPYQLAETLCFWAKKKDEYGVSRHAEWVYSFGDFLAHGKVLEKPKHSENKKTFSLEELFAEEREVERETTLFKFLKWIDSKRKRTVKVHIDKWDTWNMDSTLALIVLPMLKQLQETKHGSAIVEMEDVPEHLRSTTNESWEPNLVFDFYKESAPKEDPLHARWDWVLSEMIFAFEHIVNTDWEMNITDRRELVEIDARIKNGLILFGKYYRGLWD